MSGPKIVNIEAVRREQQRSCERQLRELQDTVAEWESCLARAGTLTEEMRAGAQAVLQRLARLRTAENWHALAQELPSQLDFFREEVAKARRLLVENIRVDQRRRQLELSAALVERELQAAGLTAPAALTAAIRNAGGAGGLELAKLEAVVQRCVRELAAARDLREKDAKEERLRALAAKYSGDLREEHPLSARSVQNSQMQEGENRIVILIAEIESWDGEAAVEKFVERANAISLERDAARRALLTDSLIIELGAFRAEQRRKQNLLERLRKARALLEPFSSAEAETFKSSVEAALARGGAPSDEALPAIVEAWCEEESKREDARLRRDAVLRALATLGYEVQEGMATAWAENGRIVVRKPSELNYGLELMTPAAVPALQVRVVAFDHGQRGSASVLRDKEVEEAWCSEFQRMQRIVEEAGFKSVVERATAAGATRMKVISSGNSAPPRTAIGSKPKQLTE